MALAWVRFMKTTLPQMLAVWSRLFRNGLRFGRVRRHLRPFCETEAIVLVAQGLKPKEIAGRMHCSEPTAYGHLTRVCAKTGCNDYHEVVAKLLAFACQAVGHTPPDHRACLDPEHAARR
jgi:DNA-binding CsgD family transcriptional regulator